MSQVETSAAAPGVLYLALGSARLDAAVRRKDGWEVWPSVEITATGEEGGGAMAPLLAALTQLRAAAPTGLQALRVVVDERWLATTSLPWSSDLRHEVLGQQLARASLMSAGCELAAADVVRLDDARYGAPRWVVAYPEVLLEALRQVAAAWGAALSSVQPLAAAAWAARRALGAAQPPVMGLSDAGAVSVLVGRGRLTEVHVQTPAEGQTPNAALERLWARLQLRDPLLAGVTSLPVLSLQPRAGVEERSRTDASASPGSSPVPVSAAALSQSPAAASAASAAAPLTFLQVPVTPATEALPPGVWLAHAGVAAGTALDAVESAGPTSWRAWWPAAAAGIAALALSVGAWQSLQAAAGARTQLQAAQRASLTPAATSPAWTRDELARVKVVNQAVRELNLPIEALLAALQPPRDLPVSVLGVEVTGTPETVGVSPAGSASVSTLRLQAESGSALDMARYVAFVGDRRPMVGAHLVRHEVVAAADGERRYRFTVEVAWRD